MTCPCFWPQREREPPTIIIFNVLGQRRRPRRWLVRVSGHNGSLRFSLPVLWPEGDPPTMAYPLCVATIGAPFDEYSCYSHNSNPFDCSVSVSCHNVNLDRRRALTILTKRQQANNVDVKHTAVGGWSKQIR